MIKEFLEQVKESIDKLNIDEIDDVVRIINEAKENGGRLFIIGSGGGAGHASHAVADFRKICEIEAYAPYDNISELTARVNDSPDGYMFSILDWLFVSKIDENDCLLVISVGGGTDDVSNNLVAAIQAAKSMEAKVVGIVGRDGGKTKELADACILIKTDNYTTPITEGMQSVILHCMVTHPLLQKNKTKW